LTRRSPATAGDQAHKRYNCESLHRSMNQQVNTEPVLLGFILILSNPIFPESHDIVSLPQC
jgi:hypothetical protein